ncbi:MAG: carbohydrate ABC transporter permease [Thermodesulfobacteriota bacterium]
MQRKHTTTWWIVFYAVIIASVVVFLFPVFYLLMTSLKSRPDIYVMPPKFIFAPTVEAWILAFTKKPLFYYFFNSAVVAAGSTIVSLIFGTLAAYALARFRIRGSKDISFFILSIRMFPPIAAAIPIFLFMKQAQLLDTRLGLICAYTVFNLPFVVWMMREFILAVPVEIEEAAMVDGLTRMQAFRKILLPLLRPSLVAVAIFCVIFSWSEFLFSFLLTQTKAKTMPVSISEFITWREVTWEQVSAAGTALVVPVLAFSFFVQKYLVRGLSFGAVKE